MKAHAKGQEVRWKWGSGKPKGRVLEHFESRITKKCQGKNISRKGSKENPAYFIEQSNGHRLLKLHSELV